MQDQFEWKSVSTSKQEHRFFERFLNNDLEKMAADLQGFYNKIETATLAGVSPVAENEAWKESNSVSTMKWREYNVFQFYTTEIYNVYKSVSEMVKEACEYYEINFDDQKFVIQGWFNINYKKSGKLNWHEHGPSGAPNFHGYYSIASEPSETHYITSAGPKVNVNLNNRAVLSEMGHPHAMADWDWDGPRITLAYDVMPLSTIENNPDAKEQHWFPLN